MAMGPFLDKWTVGPHGELEEVDERLLGVVGEIPMRVGTFPRRMTIIGLSGGRTAIWSAIALREPEMARIETLGNPAVMIVPGPAHRRDLRMWKGRYPRLKVLCPPGARDQVAEVVPVDATDGAVLEDPTVAFEVVPGTGGQEAALRVRRPAGVTLVVNDVLSFVRRPHGLAAWVTTRLFGFGFDRPRTSSVVARSLIKDPAAFASAVRAWAAIPDLIRLIMSHGDIVENQARGALERAARDWA